MWDFLVQNKDWIFNGAGVAFAAGVIAVVGRLFLRRRGGASDITQSQRAGTQATAIQAGRDVIINPVASQAQPSVRVRVHKALLLNDPRPRFFINVVNDSGSPDVEITHVWYAGSKRIEILEPSRPLPRRLRASESWETFVPVAALPADADAYRNFRVRLSTDQVLPSEERRNVPPAGFVPGA